MFAASGFNNNNVLTASLPVCCFPPSLPPLPAFHSLSSFPVCCSLAAPLRQQCPQQLAQPSVTSAASAARAGQQAQVVVAVAVAT